MKVVKLQKEKYSISNTEMLTIDDFFVLPVAEVEGIEKLIFLLNYNHF